MAKKIIRGTTPTIIFNNFGDISPLNITAAILTVTQTYGVSSTMTKIKKDLDDAEATASTLSWTLSQEDTFSLAVDKSGKTKILCNWLTDGIRGTSEEVDVFVLDNPVNEVMT